MVKLHPLTTGNKFSSELAFLEHSGEFVKPAKPRFSLSTLLKRPHPFVFPAWRGWLGLCWSGSPYPRFQCGVAQFPGLLLPGSHTHACLRHAVVQALNFRPTGLWVSRWGSSQAVRCHNRKQALDFLLNLSKATRESPLLSCCAREQCPRKEHPYCPLLFAFDNTGTGEWTTCSEIQSR